MSLGLPPFFFLRPFEQMSSLNYHLVVFLVYESVQDATTRLQLRACDHLLRDRLLVPRGTLTNGKLFLRASSLFYAWTAFVQLKKDRRRRVQVVRAWCNVRRNLHTDDTPILPFGEV